MRITSRRLSIAIRFGLSHYQYSPVHRLENDKYEPVHDALRAGIKLLEKYYHRADDTDAYFIAHSMRSL